MEDYKENKSNTSFAQVSDIIQQARRYDKHSFNNQSKKMQWRSKSKFPSRKVRETNRNTRDMQS